MPLGPDSTLADVCFAVCTALLDVGTTAVLSGGSAATYYAADIYQSFDADFVITLQVGASPAADAMKSLGFELIGETYEHPNVAYAVEFVPGPLAVGGRLVKEWATVLRGGETLFVLSRTDCTMDRLAHFYHWGDRNALRAAVGVAGSGTIDLATIAAWSIREGERSKFAEFQDRLFNANA